ncbi:MAG TPA: SPFH domain-containing protein [Kouleothrix sp.]|uniref:SPFH domain-containing protein n=1 Tax=Kouleothrix sp. TaxID=2779161 RepID=UPI002BD04923|nr:SPFH domain-containing protein [Kouleothrix sp.]HRC76079.1 SPFH domain-containing protein [Kouleothrix sp.]
MGGILTIVGIGLGLILLLVFASGFIRYIPNNRVGIIEKLVSGRGSIKSGFIALRGEAGFQPNVLRGGWHVLTPFQFRIHSVPLVTIPQGKIGYVFARDGLPLEPTQALGSNVRAGDFQDVGTFLANGGQKGPQRQILREGTYAINLAQFVVLTEDTIYYLALDRNEDAVFKRMVELIRERGGFQPVVIKGADDLVGIVTVHDGPSLPQGEIIAPTVGDTASDTATYHNNFQDPERFLLAGGMRGRQLQVLVEGTYYINRLFATVEMIPKTIIEVGNVGVVVSYTGDVGIDLSGEEYKHGEMVSQGSRGVWNTPLLPGKYAFNTYAGKVIMVPTTNIILKWNRSETGAHRLDENLAEISLITKDAFEPSLPLSVVVHIDYRQAPLVIQRFGDVKRLVEQTLDPMVSAYFKNIGQTRTLIQLIQDRSVIQSLSGEQMREKFAHYNLELEEVLIGTPTSSQGDQKIEQILTQLRARQIAEEQIETYNRQEKAAVKERELREAESRARQQQALTESEISITVQSNQGKAEYQRSLQQAAQIRALAEAEAEKAARIGIGEAIAIEEKVRAYGGPQFQVTQQVMSRFAEAIEHAGVDVVPRMVVGGGANGNGAAGGGSLMEGLLAMLLSERMGVQINSNGNAAAPEVEALRRQIRDGLLASRAQEAAPAVASPATVPTTPLGPKS